MKLKLSTQGTATIISVNEDILPPHMAILKAGIGKLARSGIKTIILDLTAVTKIEPHVLNEISTLGNFATQNKTRLILASPTQGLGHATTLQEAIGLAELDLSSLLATEAALNAQLEKLQKRKSELRNKVSVVSSNSGQIRKLRRENSTLKHRTQALESQVTMLMKNRVQLVATPPIISKADAINKILVAILEQEGVLPVR